MIVGAAMAVLIWLILKPGYASATLDFGVTFTVQTGR